MKKFAWITDTTCGLSKEYIKENNIHVLPLSVVVNGVSYKVDVDLTKEAIYEKLRENGEGASTSQPTYGECIELYENLKENYEAGIAIHASKALTGTYESSVSAAKQSDFPMEAIDSKIGSYALGKMIEVGVAMQKQGKSLQEIAKTLRDLTNKTTMYILPENLQQLKNSGRVSTTQAIFASLLHINILLGFDNGKVVIKDKIRTKKRAEKKVFQLIGEAIEKYQLDEICVMYAGVKEKAFQWKQELESKYKQTNVRVETLVPVAGVHTGYGTMAVAWFNEKLNIDK